MQNTLTHTHTHTHTMSDRGICAAVKDSLEIVIEQVCLDDGFERGGRIREGLRQIVLNRWASVRKGSITKYSVIINQVETQATKSQVKT